MKRADVNRLAIESELYSGAVSVSALDRFAALVAAAEREACAKIVEQYCGAWDDAGYALSQAIRERGKE